MSKRRDNLFNRSPQAQQTFRFDSRIQDKQSRYKSSRVESNIQSLNFSFDTSQVIREAQLRNQNILQLLQESQVQRKTQKNEKKVKNSLWDFFARFQKQSNPDITISDIEFPQNKQFRKNVTNQQSSHQNAVSKDMKLKCRGNTQKRQLKYISNQLNKKQVEVEDENSRYPRRNRLQPLRYWLGQKCVYKGGKIVNILRVSPSKNLRQKQSGKQ